MVADKGYSIFFTLIPRALLVLSIIITLVLGFLCGILYESRKDIPSYPIQFVDDINPYVPYMKVLGLSNNELSIETKDHALRIENGEEILNASPNTSFSLTVSNYSSPKAAENDISEDSCIFAAAKTGKYLYPAESSQAKRLSSSKRCFSSIEEGQKAGLILWEKK